MTAIRLAPPAYKKVFKDTLTPALNELSGVSGEHEQIANCLLEVLKPESIDAKSLPDKDEDLIQELIRKIKNSSHFTSYCDPATYPDSALKEGVAKFLSIFEKHAVKEQTKAHEIQLEYHRESLQIQRETLRGVHEIIKRQIPIGLSAAASEDNVKAANPLDPRSCESKYLDSLFARGREMGKHRLPMKALHTYRQFLKQNTSQRHPKYYAVLNNMAAACIELGRNKKALEYAREAHNAAPRKSLPILNLALASFGLRRLDDALKYAMQAVSARPKDPKPHVALSIILAERGDFRGASDAIGAAISIDDKFGPAYANRAILGVRGREYDKALQDLERAVQLEPRNGEFLVHLGAVYQKKLFSLLQPDVVAIGGGTEIHYVPHERLYRLRNEERNLLHRATVCYEKALKLGANVPDNLLLGVNLAECYYMQKEYKKAEEIYQQIKVKDERHYPYQGLGDVYFFTGRFKQALRCYRRLMQVHGENAHAHNLVARALTELRRPEKAVDHLKTAIELEPHDPRYKFNLGLLYEAMGQLSLAQETFEQLQRTNQLLPEVHYRLGRVYFLEEMHASAKTEFLKAKRCGLPVELYSDLLAISAAATNDIRVAKKEFSRLL